MASTEAQGECRHASELTVQMIGYWYRSLHPPQQRKLCGRQKDVSIRIFREWCLNVEKRQYLSGMFQNLCIICNQMYYRRVICRQL